MQKQPFADVLQNSSSKFTHLKTSNFNKKENPHKNLCKYQKKISKQLLYGTPLVTACENGQRINFE